MKNINLMKRVFIWSLMKRNILVFMLFGAALTSSAELKVDFQRKYQENKAEELLGTQKYPEALAAFEKLAAYLREQKKYDEALEILNRMTPPSECSWVHAKLLAAAQTLTEAGRTEEAINTYREIVDAKWVQENKYGVPLLAFGNILASAGRTEEAIAACNKLIASEQQSSADKELAKKALEKLGKQVK